MDRAMNGVVTIVQEGRFQVTDDGGVSHLFILGPSAAAGTDQLHALQQRQVRVRVEYRPARNVIAHTATAIYC